MCFIKLKKPVEIKWLMIYKSTDNKRAKQLLRPFAIQYYSFIMVLNTLLYNFLL